MLHKKYSGKGHLPVLARTTLAAMMLAIGLFAAACGSANNAPATTTVAESEDSAQSTESAESTQSAENAQSDAMDTTADATATADASKDESAADDADAAKEADATDATDTDSSRPAGVATGDETIAAQSVGFEGMIAVTADELAEGTYRAEVDSSSSMFKIVECLLTVKDGQMTARMKMSGKGYSKVFMGTAEEAAAAAEDAAILAETDSEGAVYFTVPVSALNEEISCSAFSKKKELWYDRSLVFLADSLDMV